MIDRAIRYLKEHSATFRLVSHPVAEPLPAIGQRPPPNGQIVDTHVVLVDAAPGLACVPAGVPLDLVSFAQEIQGFVMAGSARDLPAPFDEAEHVPPLGGLVGVPVFLDSRVAPAIIAFRAFGRDDLVEMSFDDFARIEKPRVVAIAVAGALPEFASDEGAPVIPATDAPVAGRGAPTPPPMAERASGMPVPIDEERTRLAPPEPPARRGEKRPAAQAKHAQEKHAPAQARHAPAHEKHAPAHEKHAPAHEKHAPAQAKPARKARPAHGTARAHGTR